MGARTRRALLGGTAGAAVLTGAARGGRGGRSRGTSFPVSVSCYAALKFLTDFAVLGMAGAGRTAAGKLRGRGQPGGGVRAWPESADRRNRGGKIHPHRCAGTSARREGFSRSHPLGRG